MVRYAENELFSITDFTKQISSLLKDIKNSTLEKVGVLKNNRLEAVVLSTKEYNRLKAIEEKYLEQEHREIYDVVQERKQTPHSEYISMEEMAENLNIDLKSL